MKGGILHPEEDDANLIREIAPKMKEIELKLDAMGQVETK